MALAKFKPYAGVWSEVTRDGQELKAQGGFWRVG